MGTRLGSTLSVVLCIGQLVHASPHRVRQEISPPATTDIPQGGGSNAFKTAWIPVVAFFGAVIVLILFYKYLWPRFSRPPTTTTSSAPTGEAILSAGQGSNNNNTDGAAAQPRRRRRQRRPSQISTRSLPAYMLEAGDNEITLDRSRANASDESDEEDSDGDTPGHQRSDSQSTDARQSTDGVNMNTPLLDNPSTQAEDTAPRPSMDSHFTRASHTTRETDHSHIPLMDMDRNGDLAPSYFEVVGEGARASAEPPAAPQDSGNTDTQPGNLEAGTAATQGHQRRQSLFRRWLSPFIPGQNETDAAPAAPTANNNTSSSNNNNNNEETVRGHHRNASTTSFLGRYSQSGSSSNIGFPLSRDRSNSSGLPMRQMPGSVVSLREAIISAPLPDSVVRSSFSYPSSGQPTPEQVKFLSSTQSLLKYGVRVGENPNAVPPPSFDSVIGTSSSTSGAASSHTADNSSLPSPGDTQSSPSSTRSPLNVSTTSSHNRRPSESSADAPQDTSLPAVEELPTPITATSEGFGTNPLTVREPAKRDDVSEFGVMTSDHPEAQIPLPLSRATTVASRASIPHTLTMDDFGERRAEPVSTISTARSYATAMTKPYQTDDGEDTETEESTLEKIRRRSLRGPVQLDNISLDDRPNGGSTSSR